MANPTRILFISGEVTPFAKQSEVAHLVRTLPEKLQERENHEARIMMPRYGLISERRNRLHEVIRLSGTDVPMGDEQETLKVKVASIPGVRLQVYFMDNTRYFKRKGIYTDKQGKRFSDNPQRALFFARATLETIGNLGWGPDVVHAFGWMSALVPLLLRTEYAEHPLFENVKSVFTPNLEMPGDRFAAGQPAALGLPADAELEDVDFDEIGTRYADGILYPPSDDAATGVHGQFSANEDEQAEQAAALYDQILSSVPA